MCYLRGVPDPRLQTWSSLLAVWSDFARSTAALPKVGNAGLLRRSVPAIIGLQAICHALRDLDSLGAEEYRSGQDRAALTIRTLNSELESIWKGEQIPETLRRLMTESPGELERTRSAGYEFVPESGVYTTTIEPADIQRWCANVRFDGRIWLAAPGRRVRAGLPVLFALARSGAPIPGALLADLGDHLPGCLWRRIPRIRQVYESVEEHGVRQVAREEAGESLPGTSMLREVETWTQGAGAVGATVLRGAANTPASL